jgi:catalase
MATLYEQIVDGMGAIHGVHPGYRAAHAKGKFCRGSFTASDDARELSRATHLQGDRVEVSARFSNGSGNPEAPDADRRDGRGLAVKFHLPDGSETDIVSVSIPVFFVRTGEDFLDFTKARKPTPDGEIDMERVGAFLDEHPETAEALQSILPALTPPASYAQCTYRGLHAFGLVDEGGERRFVRYRWMPEAGERMLSEDEIESAEDDYLQTEITERFAAGPVRFELRAQLAGEGDSLTDPTVAWPDDRPDVALGTLELTELDTKNEETEDDGGVVVFDPMNVTDGIECSDDEILSTRSPAYSVSIERRAAARAAG